MIPRIIVLALALTTTAIMGCGSSPARTQTTQSSSVERVGSGGEVRRSSTETQETADDGTRTMARTETTESSTPPPAARQQD